MQNILNLKKDFPVLVNNPDLAYLDTGATALKPKCVLDKMNEYYNDYCANSHRGDYDISFKVDDEIPNGSVLYILPLSNSNIVGTCLMIISSSKIGTFITWFLIESIWTFPIICFSVNMLNPRAVDLILWELLGTTKITSSIFLNW